jgi:hypothetical protein
MQTYPNYVYRPNKNKSKVDKRRQNRRQSAKESPTNSSNNSVENKATSGATVVRRKSSKNANRPLSKLDLPLSMSNGMAGFNMQHPSSISMNQQQSSTNSTSHTDPMTSNSSYILPSPEIPLLTTHFTDNPEEFVTSQSQLTPITPLTPHTPLTPISTPEQMQIREHDFKIRQQQQQFQNSMLRYIPEEDLNAYHHHQQQQQQQQQHHHHQGNAPQYPFQTINGLTSFHHPTTHDFHPVDQFEFCLVPDVAHQQRQMMAEMMLHHDEHHHHINPTTTTIPSSNSASVHPASTIPVQFYSSGANTTAATLTGNPSFTEMLGFELNFLNHAPDHQYLQ